MFIVIYRRFSSSLIAWCAICEHWFQCRLLHARLMRRCTRQ